MLKVAQTIVAETFTSLRVCGARRYECVAFWTGPAAATDLVDRCDHPKHTRSPGGYQIDDDWLTAYWFRLAREHQSIRAQLHTHPGEAFHSRTDDCWPVIAQPGFVSIVIPDFATGPESFSSAWVVSMDSRGAWK